MASAPLGPAYRGRSSTRSGHRARALTWFVLAAVYGFFAQQAAAHAALLLTPGPFALLVRQLLLVVLLLAGFASMAALGQRSALLSEVLGLPRRPGTPGEWALGAAIGWGGIIACVLPVALTGGLLVTGGARDLGMAGALVMDLLTLLLAALADELLFRGYPFQQLLKATSPVTATLVVTLMFVFARGVSFAASPGSVLATLLLGFLLAMAYLRTRGLWVGWGFRFGWTASMAILFGLPVSGSVEFSPLASTYTAGPAWLTGGGYGPEGSAVAVVVLLVLLFVMAAATRGLRHRWATPEIVGAGIPVDIDALQQRQHASGMSVEVPPPAGATLVQILPAPPAAPPRPEQDTPPDA